MPSSKVSFSFLVFFHKYGKVYRCFRCLVVIGEKNIAPSSIVQCVFKLRLASQAAPAAAPAIDNSIEESDDEDETDAVKKAKDEALKKKAPVPAYNPYWPEVRRFNLYVKSLLHRLEGLGTDDYVRLIV